MLRVTNARKRIRSLVKKLQEAEDPVNKTPYFLSLEDSLVFGSKHRLMGSSAAEITVMQTLLHVCSSHPMGQFVHLAKVLGLLSSVLLPLQQCGFID